MAINDEFDSRLEGVEILCQKYNFAICGLLIVTVRPCSADQSEHPKSGPSLTATVSWQHLCHAVVSIRNRIAKARVVHQI